jgi:GTP cyclohydrolase I
MVIVRDIPFVTLCAHHLVPFMGHAHVAYVPGSKLAGLSKFKRLVNYYSKGCWNQETLTQEIATALEEHLVDPVGVAVIMTAEHLCMTIRGAQSPGTTTTTSCMRGCFADHAKKARQEFLYLLRTP